MANLKLVVDGKTEIDSDPAKWNDNPPQLLNDQLKAGAKHAPWMRPTMMVIADAVSREGARLAGLPLPPVGEDWTISVHHDGENTTITVETHG